MVTTSIPEKARHFTYNLASRDIKVPSNRGVIHKNSDMFQYQVISRILLESLELPPIGDARAGSIWTAEANHRALSLTHLILLLHAAHPRSRQESISDIEECELAKKLTETYHSLEYHGNNEIVSCKDVIHSVVHGLLSVFRGVGKVEKLSIHVGALFLRMEKRRALALLISVLVIDMLREASKRATTGRLTISCSRIWNEGMDFRVESSCPLSSSFASPGHAVVCTLSGILEAEISYSEPRNGGTFVKLLIPFERI
jgi:hypothetical protein